MLSSDQFLGYMQAMCENIPDAPTPEQWAAIKRKLALAAAPASDWHEPPFRNSNFIGDVLPSLLPQLTC